jgi:hypothetical protein
MNAVTADKFGNDMFAQMYDVYKNADLLGMFRFCEDAIMHNTVSSNKKKANLVNVLRKCKDKDQMVTCMTNIMLAGEGLSVAQVYA